MIDFSTLQGLTIPEGVVTQITDASGRVLWMLNVGGPVILEVEKITSNTYAGETTYTGEQFILLDIYPKTNGTVSVTYGGLTKTITDTSGAEEPNAQQVYFGTFNGVSDSVATPESGALTIDGDCVAFGIGAYDKTSKDILQPYCGCITAINNFGKTNKIANNAFGAVGDGSSKKLTHVKIPSQILSIGDNAFYSCEGLTNVTIENGVKSFGKSIFGGCKGLNSINIPASVESIGKNPFSVCNINNPVTIDSANGSYNMENNCLIEIATNRLVSGFNDSVIPPYVTIIGESAFNGCEALTNVTIPASVTNIEDGAFYRCLGLTSIIVLATTPPILGGDIVFDGYSCPITVPTGCGEAYKAAENWSEYANRIVEAS